MTMADRIVVMHDGLIEQIGTPLELYDSPKNLFVAGFIGSPAMNFLKGRANSNGTIDVEGNGLPVAGSHQVADGQSVVYGIRPEHLELANEGFAAKVAVVEPTGSETMVMFRVGETELTALFRERHNFAPGQTVHLRPRPDQAHLFDQESGRRV
jgi:multiple sugar transport system ATP-binding protein